MNLNGGLINFCIPTHLHEAIWSFFTNLRILGHIASQDLNLQEEMIVSSRIESVNSCLKRLLYNSNISLCELMSEINRLLDIQDKENEYRFWRLAIPNIRNHEKANFLFTKVDQCMQQYLTPNILKIQRDE